MRLDHRIYAHAHDARRWIPVTSRCTVGVEQHVPDRRVGGHAVRNAIRSVGAHRLLLPPYSEQALAIGLIVEVFLKAEKGHRARDILLNVRYSIVYLTAIFILSPSLNAGIAAIARPLGIGWIDLDVFSTGTVAGQVGAAIVFVGILDFFYYWWHRAQHAIPWLWDQHVVHHSDTALNVSTSMRHHWSEFIFQTFMISLPMMVLFKLTPLNMWVISTVASAWMWFIHMNIHQHLGPLSWLVGGPQVHRIHHSRLSEHANKNFAAYASPGGP
jgi:sterol desaturase/sphingolipid hydroxylase (fatty acid hydroxylase superfamily)